MSGCSELFFTAVGRTPLVRLADRLYAKLETYNPTGSIKDRPISYILHRAVREGRVVPGRTLLVEATSGNTGISLSAAGAVLGCPVRIVMPCNMSEERKQMMRHFGARITEVGPSDFPGAIALRNEILANVQDSWSPAQFENPLNTECHRVTTGPEIMSDLPPDALWSAFVSGAGTGGTLSGVSEFARSRGLGTQMVLVRPDPTEKPHGIQGIGDCADYLAAGHYDDVQVVTTEEAVARSIRFARETGIPVGLSAGANLVASERWMIQHQPTGNVVTVLCDRGERYMAGL
jgi:cysteine synthase A